MVGLNENQAAASTSSVHGDARKCTNGKNSLNEQQKTAIEMLALGKGYGTTARSLQIDPSTLYRWRQMRAFRDALDDRRREVWDGAHDRLKDLAHASLEVL